MKAIVCTKAGPPEVLKLSDVVKPSPEAGEALVKIHAATVTSGDVIVRRIPRLVALPMRLMGLRMKTIPGHEFAGEVEAVGTNVTRYAPGDRVFGTTTGLSAGSYAEYTCLPADGMLAAMPADVAYEDMAAVPIGALTALHYLQKANIQAGQNVLIYGASGSVGTFAVQLARYFGAEVTGVCSTSNLEMVTALGADTVIDYTQEDFTESGETYDVIFDAVGKTSPSDSKKVLAPEGAYVSVRKGMASESVEGLAFLAELIEAGKLTAVIDKRYPLEQAAEAHRYVEQGHKKGNVVLTVDHNGRA